MRRQSNYFSIFLPPKFDQKSIGITKNKNKLQEQATHEANFFALNVISCCIFNWGGGHKIDLVEGTLNFAEDWKEREGKNFLWRWVKKVLEGGGAKI